MLQEDNRNFSSSVLQADMLQRNEVISILAGHIKHTLQLNIELQEFPSETSCTLYTHFNSQPVVPPYRYFHSTRNAYPGRWICPGE